MTTLDPIHVPSTVLPAPTVLTPVSSSTQASSGMSFGDVLDAVNPLQHIPVVSSLYRSVTGSTISSGSQIAGDTVYGALLGGPLLAGAALGFGSSVTDVTVKQTTGQGIAGHVLSTLGLSSTTPSTATASTPASTAATPTLLTAVDPATIASSPGAGPRTPAEQANAAAAIMLHGTHPERSNAQYTRTQAMDALNKHLVKITL